MDSIVIVALPETLSRINQISSEVVPHMTLLYLDKSLFGEREAQYVEHAASSLGRMWASVDRRGTLGEDDADVLFFDREYLRDAERFRHELLLDNGIRRAYDAAEQFPDWIAHLTLGYPDRPATEPENEYELRSVHFDRIGILDGDTLAAEFRLRDTNTLDVAMSDIQELGRSAAEATLAHYGVKGMKWGVRKDNGHEGETVKTKKLGKLDKKWEKENTGQRGYFKAHNAMADRMNKGMIDDFNNDPRWKDIDFNDPKNAHHEKTYMDEFFKLSDKVFREEMVKLGSNPSGTKRFELKTDADGNEYVELVDTKVKHSEGDVKLVFSLKRDKLRHISSLTPEERELKHYGVKGMKWGVRKDDKGASSGPTPVTITQKKPGTFAKATGGERNPIHDDAKTALESRQKAKRSTTDSLSNVELQRAVQRMQLENQFRQLEFESDRRSSGKRFIAGFMGNPRYNGQKRRYADSDETVGSMTRSMIKTSLDRTGATEAIKAALKGAS